MVAGVCQISASIVEDALASILSGFGARAANIGVDQVREWLARFRDSASPSAGHDLWEVDELASAVMKRHEAKQGQQQYNAEIIARWLEIPEADLAGLTPENFDSNVLIQHIMLEAKFQQWFSEWGYVAEAGEILRPADMPELECEVDVYGKLQTIHGTFEVAVNFVCDNPPDENRVIALSSKIGAYADSRETFASNDVFMIVTPWDFTPVAYAALRHQNKKRMYCVLGVDGGILHDLDTAENPKGRLMELQERVQQANLEAECKR